MKGAHRLAQRVALAVGLLVLGGESAARPDTDASTRLRAQVIWTVPLPDALAQVPLVEPWLSIDPADPEHMVGAAMVVGGSDGLRTVVFSTRDGGRTWSVGTRAESGDMFFPDGDPVVAIAPDGVPYLSTLEDGFAVWKTTDSLWHRVGTVPGGSYDRQWLAFDGSGGRHHGRLYTAGKIPIQVTGRMAEDVAAFSWSDDGGETFRDPVLVLPDPVEGSLNIVSQLVVLPDGSLVAPYHFIHWPGADAPANGSPGPLDGAVAVLRSEDGRRWDEPVRVGRKRMWGHGDRERMFKGLGAGGLVAGSVGPRGATLHLTWPDVQEGSIRIVAASSTDGGRTWSDPVRVDRGGPPSNASNPGVAVDGRGRVAVIWNDRRDDPADRCFRPYVAVSTDGGGTFDAGIPLSDAPVCPGAGRWMNGGDTQGIVGLPAGGFQAVWVGDGNGSASPVRLYSSRIGVQ